MACFGFHISVIYDAHVPSSIAPKGEIWTAGDTMRCNRKAGPVQPSKSPTVLEAQEDQKFEERKRIVEHLVRALREAGYSSDLGDSGSARTLRRDN